MFTLPRQEEKEYILDVLSGAKAVALHNFASEHDSLIVWIDKAISEMKSIPAETIDNTTKT